MRKFILCAILLAMLTAGCNKDSPEGASSAPLEYDLAPASQQRISDVAPMGNPEVKITTLERVYESKGGIQFISRYKFQPMINDNKTFQLECADLADTKIVRIDATEYQPVDYQKLAADQELFKRQIVAQNVDQKEAVFRASGNMTTYTYKNASNEFCAAAAVERDGEVFKLYTQSRTGYYGDPFYTVRQVAPKSPEIYDVIPKEILRCQVGSIAVNSPCPGEDFYEVANGEKKLVVHDGDEVLNVFMYKGRTAEDLPNPETLYKSLNDPRWSYEQVENDAGDAYFMFTHSTDTGTVDQHYGVRARLVNDVLYVVTAQGMEIPDYLATMRLANEPDIFTYAITTQKTTAASSGGLLQEEVTLGNFVVTIPKGSEPSYLTDHWRLEIAADDYFDLSVAMNEMTQSRIKNKHPDIDKVVVEGDHFLGTTKDGQVYYLRQIELDGIYWNVTALGTHGFSIAKSITQSPDYVDRRNRGWQRMTFDKCVFMAPIGTQQVSDGDNTFFKFPSGEVLLFEKPEKSLKIDDYKDSVIIDDCLIYTGTAQPMCLMNLSKQFLIQSSGVESLEALYTIKTK